MAIPLVLTVDYIRSIVQDRGPEDNSIENDKFFSDEDIITAMEMCAANYNAIAPLGIDVVNPAALPARVSVFMDGVLANLYKMARQKLARNAMPWHTGNTSVELEKNRLEMFSMLQKELEASFQQSAKERKVALNRELAWGWH